MKQQHGFTLIELLVAVAVIGILARLAIPAYSDYVTRGRIPDATAALADKRVKMEQYFQDKRNYTSAPFCGADSTTSKYFDFSCASGSLTATTYTLQAVGKGAMAGFTYTVNQSGVKATTAVPTGWTGNANCWVTKKGGTC